MGVQGRIEAKIQLHHKRAEKISVEFQIIDTAISSSFPVIFSYSLYGLLGLTLNFENGTPVFTTPDKSVLKTFFLSESDFKPASIFLPKKSREAKIDL